MTDLQVIRARATTAANLLQVDPWAVQCPRCDAQPQAGCITVPGEVRYRAPDAHAARYEYARLRLIDLLVGIATAILTARRP